MRIRKTTLAMIALPVAGLLLFPAIAFAATQTSQGIMVNLDAEGNFTIKNSETYEFNEVTAATYFTNTWDGLVPAETFSLKESSVITYELTAPLVETPSNPIVAVPANPAENPSKLNTKGENDVLGDNKCRFLDGNTLTGLTYTQIATASAQGTYVSEVTLMLKGPNTGKYKVTRITVTKTGTYTYIYNVSPNTTDFVSILAAWDFVSSSGESTARILINAEIAGQSVTSSSKTDRKYSFSLLNSDGTNRVQNLVITANGVPYAAGSVVKFPVDFFYTTNAGSSGVTTLLKNGDARTTLNTDSFNGNNNGGTTGSALALAIMNAVPVDLAPGLHSVDLTGTVKGNSATTNIAFKITQIVNIITPGCSGKAA